MEVVGLRILFGTIKAEKLNPEYARVALGPVPERRTSMDRSKDKAKFSEKNANRSGRPIRLAGSLLSNQCHVWLFLATFAMAEPGIPLNKTLQDRSTDWGHNGTEVVKRTGHE